VRDRADPGATRDLAGPGDRGRPLKLVASVRPLSIACSESVSSRTSDGPSACQRSPSTPNRFVEIVMLWIGSPPNQRRRRGCKPPTQYGCGGRRLPTSPRRTRCPDRACPRRPAGRRCGDRWSYAQRAERAVRILDLALAVDQVREAVRRRAWQLDRAQVPFLEALADPVERKPLEPLRGRDVCTDVLARFHTRNQDGCRDPHDEGGREADGQQPSPPRAPVDGQAVTVRPDAGRAMPAVTFPPCVRTVGIGYLGGCPCGAACPLDDRSAARPVRRLFFCLR
jgi:hypothetical protein